MAIEQAEVQALPFVVEPLAPARLKLWARLAGYVSTDDGFTLVSRVYRGFWYEAYTFRVYTNALSHVERAAAGDRWSASHLVSWLNMLAWGLGCVIEDWTEVQECLLPSVGGIALSRHAQDVNQRLASAMQLLAEVRTFGVAVCQEFGLVIPESFVEQRTSPTVPAAGEGAENL